MQITTRVVQITQHSVANGASFTGTLAQEALRELASYHGVPQLFLTTLLPYVKSLAPTAPNTGCSGSTYPRFTGNYNDPLSICNK